jgi:hypothetical protein
MKALLMGRFFCGKIFEKKMKGKSQSIWGIEVIQRIELKLP